MRTQVWNYVRNPALWSLQGFHVEKSDLKLLIEHFAEVFEEIQVELF